MPQWLNKYMSFLLVFSLLFSSSIAPVVAAEPAVTPPPVISGVGAEPADTKEDIEQGEKASGVLNSLLLTLAGSPVLVKVISGQLKKYGNQKMASWARESYFLVGQAVATAERTGVISAEQGYKTKLYRDQFGKIMKEAGWLERAAMRTAAGPEKMALDSAAYQARKISRRTYQGEVAGLQAEKFISDIQASEFLDIQKRGIMTPRELGGFLLTETNLKSTQIAELLRTYRTSQGADSRVRISGGRDSRYDTAVLELLGAPQGKKYTKFASITSREFAARYLTFQGDVNDFSKIVMADGKLSGADSAKLIDEFAMEASKDQAFFGKKATLNNNARPSTVRKNALAPDVGPSPLKKNSVITIDAPQAAQTTKKSQVQVSERVRVQTSDPVSSQTSTKVVNSDTSGPRMASSDSIKSSNVADFKPFSKSSTKKVSSKLTSVKKSLTKLTDSVGGFSRKLCADSGWKEVKASYSSKDGFLGYKGKWTGGGIDGVKQSLRYDAFRGGILVDAGMSAITGLISRMSTGESLKDSVTGTLGAIISTEFVFGDLLGGTIGAAMGAAIPLPAALQTMGAFGRFLGVLPGVSLAIAGSQFGYGAVSLMKRGQFSLATLFNEVKPGLVIGQAIGAAVGMTIGTLLIPGPIGAMLGGIVGGMIGSKFATMIFGYRQDEALAQISHTVPVTGSTIDVDSEVGDALEGIDINYPDTSDMRAVDEAVKDAYSAYIRAQKSGNYLEATAQFKTYGELQRILNVLLSRGYRVK